MSLSINEVRGFESRSLYDGHQYEAAKRWMGENFMKIRSLHQRFDANDDTSKEEKTEILNFLTGKSDRIWFRRAFKDMLAVRNISFTTSEVEFVLDGYAALKIMCENDYNLFRSIEQKCA